VVGEGPSGGTRLQQVVVRTGMQSTLKMKRRSSTRRRTKRRSSNMRGMMT
jgi:hypothetical protein